MALPSPFFGRRSWYIICIFHFSYFEYQSDALTDFNVFRVIGKRECWRVDIWRRRVKSDSFVICAVHGLHLGSHYNNSTCSIHNQWSTNIRLCYLVSFKGQNLWSTNIPLVHVWLLRCMAIWWISVQPYPSCLDFIQGKEIITHCALAMKFLLIQIL